MSDIKPALTAEEWADGVARWENGQAAIYLRDTSLDNTVSLGEGGALEAIRHKAAALCLYGQAFGFTWEDVDVLRDAMVNYDTEFDDPTTVTRLGSIADRIAALLPPREGS